MLDVEIRKLVPYDYIQDDNAWEIIKNNLQELLKTNDKVRVLVKGVTIVNPCNLNNYIDILKMDNVVIRFFGDNSKFADASLGKCILLKIDKSKIEVEPREVVKKESAQETRRRKRIEMTLEKFKVSDNKIIFYMHEDADGENKTSIDNINTLQAIRDGAKIMKDKTGINNIDIDFNKCKINDYCYKAVSDMIICCREEGINIDVVCDDQETMNKIAMSLKNSEGNVDKTSSIKKIKKNTVGILVKFKKSNGLDTFGRRGNGEVAFSRVAIFRGFDESDNKFIIIDTIHKDNFKTKMEVLVANDFNDDGIHNMTFKTEKIPVEEIGFYNQTIGSTYNFLYPEQQSLEEYTNTIIGINVDGTNIRKKMSLPERIKFILDEYDIKYNKSDLDTSIERNREYLVELENNNDNVDTSDSSDEIFIDI